VTHEEYGWHQLIGEIRRTRLALAYLDIDCPRCRHDLAERDTLQAGLLQMYPPNHSDDCPIGLQRSTRAEQTRHAWQEIMDEKTAARITRSAARASRWRCVRCGGHHRWWWLTGRTRAPSCEEKEKRRGE
jgi:hypothetical protein